MLEAKCVEAIEDVGRASLVEGMSPVSASCFASAAECHGRRCASSPRQEYQLLFHGTGQCCGRAAARTRAELIVGGRAPALRARERFEEVRDGVILRHSRACQACPDLLHRLDLPLIRDRAKWIYRG